MDIGGLGTVTVGLFAVNVILFLVLVHKLVRSRPVVAEVAKTAVPVPVSVPIAPAAAAVPGLDGAIVAAIAAAIHTKG
jgi:Na+-transporting methylmalonyl-CoA/oxaloacetate decarboxylase gamma subunit